MNSISAGKWTGIFNFNIDNKIDTSLVNSSSSTSDDITNNIKNGQDKSQIKESEYDDITLESSEEN